MVAAGDIPAPYALHIAVANSGAGGTLDYDTQNPDDWDDDDDDYGGHSSIHMVAVGESCSYAHVGNHKAAYTALRNTSVPRPNEDNQKSKAVEVSHPDLNGNSKDAYTAGN